MCMTSWRFLANAMAHTSHRYGRSPVCVRMCIVRVWRWTKLRGHKWHLGMSAWFSLASLREKLGPNSELKTFVSCQARQNVWRRRKSAICVESSNSFCLRSTCSKTGRKSPSMHPIVPHCPVFLAIKVPLLWSPLPWQLSVCWMDADASLPR